MTGRGLRRRSTGCWPLRRFDAALSDVLLPYLHDLGERWSRGEASIAQEHFASGSCAGGFSGSRAGGAEALGQWRSSPASLVSSTSSASSFGLALRSHGWRVAYLGADTPLETLELAAQSLEPALVVLSAATEDGVRRIAPEVRRLATRYPVAIGGPGARMVETADLGVLGLVGDLVAEAARIASHEHATLRRDRRAERGGTHR